MAEDQTPDLTMDGVDLDDCLLLNDGEEIVNGLVQMFQTQQFENFTVEMESGEETYECECRAAGTFKRGDRYRLYLVVNNRATICCIRCIWFNRTTGSIIWWTSGTTKCSKR